MTYLTLILKSVGVILDLLASKVPSSILSIPFWINTYKEYQLETTKAYIA